MSRWASNDPSLATACPGACRRRDCNTDARKVNMKYGIRLGAIIGFVALVVVAGGSASHAKSGSIRRFVYVPGKSNLISEFDASPSNVGALMPLTPETVPTGQFPNAIAVSPDGRNVYVTDAGSEMSKIGKVSQYTVDRRTGQLTPKSPATVATTTNPGGVVVTPNGKNVYVAGGTGSKSAPFGISQFWVNPSSGALVRKAAGSVPASPNPLSIAVSPSGKYLYVATCGGCGVTLRKRSPHAANPVTSRVSAKPSFLLEFRINSSTGVLSSKPIAKIATGNGANWIAISADGRGAYVATSSNGGTVWQYTVNPSTGKLTHKGRATVNTGAGTHNVVISPDGKNAYVVDVSLNRVAQYPISRSTGSLRSKPTSTAKTVLRPEAIVLSSNGRSAYVTSERDGLVSEYTISPTMGRITPMSPATVATRSHGALAIAITP